jgi:hypothetical protein
VYPEASVSYRGTRLEEMDLAAVLARHPQFALVDELAHTNAPGSPNEKRWQDQDIEELLDAGITVITTVNMQHLESLNDVVYDITGVRQRETVPDAVVRQAEQIELVDMTPEALRRRLAHGKNLHAGQVQLAGYSEPLRVDVVTHGGGRPDEAALLRIRDVPEGVLVPEPASFAEFSGEESRECEATVYPRDMNSDPKVPPVAMRLVGPAEALAGNSRITFTNRRPVIGSSGELGGSRLPARRSLTGDFRPGHP